MNGLSLSVHKSKSLRVISFVLLMLGLFSTKLLAEDYASSQNLDWHYTVRPDDALPDIADRLLKPQYSWASLSHYNHLKSGSELKTGSILKVPIAWLRYQPQPAKITNFKGLALIKRRQETRFTPISEKHHLYVGDELLTRDGTLELKFADETSLSLDPYSHLIFNKLSNYKDVGMVDTRMRLSRGGIRTDVAPLGGGSRYEISTPSAVAAVRGTNFRLRTNVSGTALEVLEGTVAFIHKHGMDMISAGQGARISAQSALLEKINLRAIPYTEPEENPTYAKTDELAWQGVASNQLANIEANASGSAEPVSPVRTEEIETKEAVLLASNQDTTSAGPDPAKLELPLPGSIVDGFTAEFNWSVSNVGTLSRFELSKEDSFDNLSINTKWSESTSYRLEENPTAGDYFWRVRTMTAGQEESVSTVRTVSIQGMLDAVNIVTVNYIGDQVGIFWHAVDNAKGYVLQISDDKEFRRLLKEETLSKTRAFLKLPEDKAYYARVKGLGDEVFSSEYGPLKEIYIEAKPE